MATAGGSRGAGPERAFLFPLPPSGPARLDPEEGRHLVRSRRVAVGDEVVLFDGRGVTRLARLTTDDPNGPVLDIVGPYPDREPRRRVAVAAALPGAGRADEMIAALAECGVDRFVPLSCERSNVDVAEVARRRASRFERLAREAAKVNGRSRCLRVETARSPADLAANPGEGARAILLDPDPALPRLVRVVAGMAEAEPLLLMIGPEGGWSDGERAAIRAVAVSAALWECALRTEAAAVAAAAIALGV